MSLLLALAALTSAPVPASPPQRVRSVAVQPGAACPPSKGDEVVVCYPGDEPYRIPKRFRDREPGAAAKQSWVNRTALIDEAGRTGAGLPNTCSAVGTGGQTGCFAQTMHAWAAERRAMGSGTRALP